MWEELRKWPVEPWSPFRDEASSHINYLEIYVIYYAIWLWGDHLRGCEVLVWTDNTTAEANVRDLWGKPTFLPVLKAIWLLMIKFDIRLRPVPIRSKVNVEADALSRNDWATFAESVGLSKAKAAALARREPGGVAELNDLCVNKALVISDYDDWMITPEVFWGILWARYGPFDLDAAVDIYASNTFCRVGWSILDNALTCLWDGLNVYCNPPYSLILEFLVRFLFCKQRTQVGTSALFILPVWDGPRAKRFWKLLTRYEGSVFHVVHRFPTGTQLFTSPNHQGPVRKVVGPTKWPVVAVWVSPAPLPVAIDLTEWVTGTELFT